MLYLILEGFCETGHYQEVYANEEENPCHHYIYCNICNKRVKFVNSIIIGRNGIKNGRLNVVKFLRLIDFDNRIYNVPTELEVINNRLYFVAGKAYNRWVSLEKYNLERTDYDDYLAETYCYENYVDPQEYFCTHCDLSQCRNCPYIKRL